MSDLWHIADPPPWAAYLYGVVSRTAETVTLRLAIPPDEGLVRFPRIVCGQRGSLVTRTEIFRVERRADGSNWLVYLPH